METIATEAVAIAADTSRDTGRRPRHQFANGTLLRVCASSRMIIEVQIPVGTRVAALRRCRRRPDGFKLGTSLQLKSRLLALRFGVD